MKHPVITRPPTRVALTAAVLLVSLAPAPPALADNATGSAPAIAGNSGNTCAAEPGQKLQDQDYDDAQLPWQRKGNAEVIVYFETKKLTPEFVDDMKAGVASWDLSPCVQPRLIDTCEAGTNCVTVSLEADGGDDDGNFDATERDGYTIGGHITYYTENLAEQGPTATLNVVVHEMGHAIGLRHRSTKKILMHADTNNTTKPDEIDYQNLLVLYGKQ